MIKFSVLIPAYKGRFLEHTIHSVLSQNYQEFELIIVDDCSPDDLQSIVEKFSDCRIRYYRNEKNCGAINVVDNWNICLSYSQGDYVICMGDDDCLTPCCLEDYFQLIKKYPGLGVYHSLTHVIDEGGQIIRTLEERPEFEEGVEMLINRFEGREQFIGDFCFDSNLLKKEGGFYKLPLAWNSDDITVFRASIGLGIANTQRVGFEYRENRYTISSDNMPEMKINALKQADLWYKSFFSQIEFDNKTLRQIIKAKNQRFSKMYSVQLLKLFIKNPFNIIYYLPKKNSLYISISLYLKLAFQALRS